jgi:putative NADPH-quinone reductase
MLDVFEDASHGKYQRTVVTTSESKHSSKNSGFRMEFKNGQPVVKGNVNKCKDITLTASCTYSCNAV